MTGIAATGSSPPAALARASGLVAFSACCFGSIPILVSLGLAAGTTLLTLLAWRYAIGGALLVAVGGVGQALVAGVSLSALRYIPAATLSFLFYTYPAWVALFGALRRTEPLSTRRVLALGLSFGGIVLMVGSPWSGPLPPLGVLLALASAILYAMYVPAIERLQRDVAPSIAAAYISLGAFMVLLALALGPGVIAVRLAPMSWGAVIGLGVLSTAIGFIAFLRGLRVLGPVRTAIISTVEPFWTALMGSLVLGQALTGSTLAGGLLIGLAVVVLQTRGRVLAAG